MTVSYTMSCPTDCKNSESVLISNTGYERIKGHFLSISQRVTVDQAQWRMNGQVPSPFKIYVHSALNSTS